MVHPKSIEYQFGWWAMCYKHPEYREDRNRYPDSRSFTVGLDGGYHKSLFYNFLRCSMIGEPPDFLNLWRDLLDHWDSYDALFKHLFVERYGALKQYIENKSDTFVSADPEDVQKVFSVMNEFNEKYIHLDVSDDER